MNSKWQINRVGLLDFWYYDEEEFDFLDGRMLLRGANGSGKSVTMQSFIPLLLDGNMRPERLDPFGSRARKMENYLLEEGDEREERTGYLYMELKRLESEEYLTLGIGLRARKNKKLESWYFCVTDGRRVGKDLFLYKDVENKITCSKGELKYRIGEGGKVMETQGEYAQCVNRLLFGFETQEEYKELLELLIQLRTPKLSKDFKHNFYYHGDFDPEGLLIAQRLKERYGESLQLWNYRADWYERYLSDVNLSEVRMKKLEKVYLPELLEVKMQMQKRKRAAYQEAMLDMLEPEKK